MITHITYSQNIRSPQQQCPTQNSTRQQENQNRNGQARESEPSQAHNFNNQKIRTSYHSQKETSIEQLDRQYQRQSPENQNAKGPLKKIEGTVHLSEYESSSGQHRRNDRGHENMADWIPSSSYNNLNTRPPPLVERPTKQIRPIINNGRGLLPTPMITIGINQCFSHFTPVIQHSFPSSKFLDLNHKCPSGKNINLPDIGINIASSSSASIESNSIPPNNKADERKSTESEHSSKDALPYISDVNTLFLFYRK